MHSSKILILVAIGLLCTNARVLKKKFRQRMACGCQPTPIPEPTYGCFGTCNNPSIYLDELSCGGCQYIDTYGVLTPDLTNYGRVPAIKLPKMPVLPFAGCDPGMPIASYEALPMSVAAVGNYEVLPAINLPGLCDVLPQAMPCVNELPCPSPCQCLGKCGCKMPSSMIFELPSPILNIPVEPCIQAPKCLPQALQVPPCSCQNNPCSCQPMPCGCQPMPCGCQPMPCGCQRMPCGCQSTPCSYQSVPCSCQNLPCSCQNSCECQNVYVPQLQALELPCTCQSCQLSPVELPVCAYGCQSLPPPVIGCGGKYLRQVVIQPPFL